MCISGSVINWDWFAYRLRLNEAFLVGPAQAVIKKEESSTNRAVVTILPDLVKYKCG